MNEDKQRCPGAPMGPAPEGEVLLGARELTKYFPLHRGWSASVLHPLQEEQVAVVDKVTFDVRAGETFGVLGMDGAGKSTLLRMVSGELPPDGGSATVAGYDIALQAEEVRQRVQRVPGDEGPFEPGRSAREVLEQALASRRSAWNGAAADPGEPGRVDEVLHLAELHDAGDRDVTLLTGSMKQRLLLARALLFRPVLLILDRPTDRLDSRAAQEVRDVLRGDAFARENCSLLLSTRDPREAFELCHRVGILQHGRMVAVRTPAEYLESVGTEWYRLWMQQTGLDALMALTGHRDIRGFRSHAASLDGWAQVEVEIPGGLEAAARVLASLTTAGVRIARFERVGLSLPQLIDRLDVSAPTAPGPGGAARTMPDTRSQW